MAEIEAKPRVDVTILNILGRNLYDLPEATRPTPLEEEAALRILLLARPNVRLHRGGLVKAGMRPEVVANFLEQYLSILYTRLGELAVAAPLSTAAIGTLGDNVVPIQRTHARHDTKKRKA